jgi:putative effector of murein hydrolase
MEVHDCNTQAWLPLSLLVADVVAIGLGVAAIVIAVVLFRRASRIWAKVIAVLAAILAAAAISMVMGVFMAEDLPAYRLGAHPILGCTRGTPVTPEPSPIT